VAAAAIPTASSVMTVSARLATDLSARTSVISTTIAKKPAAAIVTHIGNAGERKMESSDEAHAQFMRDVPSRNEMKADSYAFTSQMVRQRGPFDGG
jgi:tryptophanyl-tRNA synthetase